MHGYTHNPLRDFDPRGLACTNGKHDNENEECPDKKIAPPTKKKLTKGDIVRYLSDLKTKKHAEISVALQTLGLQIKGQSPDGRFVEFVDKSGNVRAKLHPPDKVTPYSHLHIYDKDGNPLDKNLNQASPRSPDAHLETGGL